jgi:DNA-binding transcriptional LysR family regulator
MDLHHLRIFYEVARRGGFTAAARTLRVSQPSLSRSVRLLEEEEQVTLLERSKRGVTLTADGRAFFASCEKIFAEVEGLKTSRAGAELSGDLALAASDNLCNHVLPRVLPAFLRQHSRVKARLFSGTSEQILEELREGRAELGLFYSEVRDRKAFETEKLWPVEFVMVRAPGGDEQAFVGSRSGDYAKAYPALAMLRSAGLDPKAVLETNNQETQKRMVMAGLGFSLLPAHMVEAELRTGRLEKMKTPRHFKGQVFLARRRGVRLSRSAEAWRDTLKNFSL